MKSRRSDTNLFRSSSNRSAKLKILTRVNSNVVMKKKPLYFGSPKSKQKSINNSLRESNRSFKFKINSHKTPTNNGKINAQTVEFINESLNGRSQLKNDLKSIQVGQKNKRLKNR